jgi:hypothetical protein
MRFLVDTNTFRHPAASHWEHQEDHLLMWCQTFIGLRKFQWKFKTPSGVQIAQEIPYVPALGAEGHAKGLRFHTYQFIELESWTVKPPVDWARRSIPELFKLERLRSRHEYNGVLLGQGVVLEEVIRRFIDRIEDARLSKIKKILGPKHSQDAFHLYVCEEHGLDGLVTLDLKLHRHFKNVGRHLKSPVRVLLPSEVCGMIGIKPVGPEWFAEGTNDIFSNGIVQLFARPASRRDKLAYTLYRGLIFLRDRCGVKTKLVLRGY